MTVAPHSHALLAVLVVAVLLVVVLFLRRRLSGRAARRYVLIDGSNVMYWRNSQPDLAPVKAVIARIRAAKAQPVVYFDANAGYLLRGRYLNNAELARALGIASNRVLIAPKGTPADPLLLEAASGLRARIVTNDRYRDWTADYPILKSRELLVRGEWQKGRLTLNRELVARKRA